MIPSRATEESTAQTASIYQTARAQGQQFLRETLLRAASEVLAQEGTAALTMRRVGQKAGCSTMVLYTMFGGKEGLVDALVLEGFQRLGEAITAVEASSEPRLYAVELCHAYRATALAYPTHYAAMFGKAIPDYEPSETTRATGQQTMRPLIGAIESCMAAGIMPPGDAADVATLVWAACHGLVSLELDGYVPGGETARRMYDDLVHRLLVRR